MSLTNELVSSIYTGFVDRSEISLAEYQPKLLVNNSKRGQKVLTNIISELNKCDEFLFSVAFITNGGVASLINTLKELEDKGIKGKIIASQYQNFTEPRALKRLTALKNVEVRIVTENNFHAKGYIFKKNEMYNVIIGSSNLTQDALSFNKEWNIKVSSLNEGSILKETIYEFNYTFDNAVVVDEAWICEYQKIYDDAKRMGSFNSDVLDSEIKELASNEVDYTSENLMQINNNRLNLIPANYNIIRGQGPVIKNNKPISICRVMPNKMQIEALSCLEDLRNKAKNKALLISATGTGKTYLSAFDVKKIQPKHFLFIVHRENIARAAMKSFKKVFGQDVKMGMLSGYSKDYDADYLFCTIQTLSKDDVLSKFSIDYFDYIVIDEVHRSGAGSYQKVLEYFKPGFLLGMSATPERMDGFDIFKAFDYNIAYEIRLNRAMEENMLCTFHYYGVSEIEVEGQLIEEKTAFNSLVCDERVDRIIEKVNLYGCGEGRVKGLVFCSRVDEASQLSKMFNHRGYKTISLDGRNSEEEREKAIISLEQDDKLENSLDYIFTVDIFNEGVDIPSVNQIIMLRPTQSSIVFIQQLGRGLRKKLNKDYVVIIDFVGNYTNNFLIPIALYGDNSYNKDHLRMLINSGNSFLPGASTINFDYITRQRIFDSINNTNMQLKKDLVKDYELLKFKIGRIPMMMDFLEHGSRDPRLYADYSRSYFNFVVNQEETLKNKVSAKEIKLFELFSNEIANAKRIEEIIILRELIINKSIQKVKVKVIMFERYGISVSDETIESCIRNINFEFITENKDNKLISVREKYELNIISHNENEIMLEKEFCCSLENEIFSRFLDDCLTYSETTYNRLFDKSKYVEGFILYQKYSRKDVFRILNWDKNPVAQNVGGYIVSRDKKNCSIFINYNKSEGISETIKYNDRFINNCEFGWMSKNRRTLNSPEIIDIRNYKNGLRIPLFIKKSNDEGTDFYYMGDMTPIDKSIEQTVMSDGKDGNVPVVEMKFRMNHPVDDSIFKYITESDVL